MSIEAVLTELQQVRALVEDISLQVTALAPTEDLLAELRQFRDLVRTLAEHVGALATRVERGTFQTTRIANASEETNALALTLTQEARASVVAVRDTLVDLGKQVAVLVDNIKDAEEAADEAAKQAGRAADNSRVNQLEPRAPRHIDREDSGKTAAGAARRAWHDFLRAPTRSQAAALMLVALLAVAVLGYFAIKNSYRAQQLEHEGAPLERKKE